MKISLIEEVKIELEVSPYKSKFNESKLLVCSIYDFGSYLAIYSFSEKNLNYLELNELYAEEFFILDDFSVIIYRGFAFNTIILNIDILKKREITNIINENEIISIHKTDYENYFFISKYYNNKLIEYYIFDVINNKIIEDLKKDEKLYNLKRLHFYSSEREKLYDYNEKLYYINGLGEKRTFSIGKFFTCITAWKITDKLIICAGQPMPEYDQTEDEYKREVNIIIWNKETTEIIYTYKGSLGTYESTNEIYYFEKYNCLLLCHFYKIALFDLDSKEIIYTNYTSALYVDEKNNKFGFYDDDTQSYKIYELVEE